MKAGAKEIYKSIDVSIYHYNALIDHTMGTHQWATYILHQDSRLIACQNHEIANKLQSYTIMLDLMELIILR